MEVDCQSKSNLILISWRAQALKTVQSSAFGKGEKSNLIHDTTRLFPVFG